MKLFLILSLGLVLLPGSLLHANPFDNTGRPVISGRVPASEIAKEITLEYYSYYILYMERKTVQLFISKSKDGKFSFRLPELDHPAYFSVIVNRSVQGERTLLNLYLVQPDDSITVSFDSGTPLFKGRGVDKYKCRAEVDEVATTKALTMDGLSKYNGELADKLELAKDSLRVDKRLVDSLLDRRLAAIDRFKSRLSSDIYALLRADCKGKMLFDYCLATRCQSNFRSDTRTARVIALYMQTYQDFERSLTLDTTNGLTISLSKWIASAIIEKAKIDIALDTSGWSLAWEKRRLKRLYEVINGTYTGPLRERALTGLIGEMFDYSYFSDEYLDSSLLVVHQPCWRNVLEDLAKSKAKGAVAMNFALPDSNGKLFQLSDFKGKVVVIDFWFTGCGACRNVADGLRYVQQKFDDSNLVYISISVDPDRKLWMRSLAGGAYTSSRETNLFTDKQGSNHPLVSYYAISAFPAVMIVDRNGRVFSTHPQWPWDRDEQKVADFISQLKSCLSI